MSANWHEVILFLDFILFIEKMKLLLFYQAVALFVLQTVLVFYMWIISLHLIKYAFAVVIILFIILKDGF